MKDWFKDWFASEEYLEVYKHRNEKDAEKLIQLILSNTELSDNSEILDAACGAGRHAITFAEMGYNVTGFDLSKTLLSIAKKNSKNKNLNIDFMHSDIREFNTTKRFDLIINLFTSFGYFETDKDNFSFIQNSIKLLKKKGYFVFDYLNKDYVVTNLVPKSKKEISGKKIFETRKIENERVVKDIEIFNGSESKKFCESVKLYEPEFIIKKFRDIGYQILYEFGNYDGEKFEPEKSNRLILICQKS